MAVRRRSGRSGKSKMRTVHQNLVRAVETAAGA